MLPHAVSSLALARQMGVRVAASLCVLRAGASQHAMAEDVTASVTDQMFALNTIGPIKLTRAALPHMLRRQRGRLVVIASMAAKVPTPGQAIYSGETRSCLYLGSAVEHRVGCGLLLNTSAGRRNNGCDSSAMLRRTGAKMALYGYFASLATEIVDRQALVTPFSRSINIARSSSTWQHHLQNLACRAPMSSVHSLPCCFLGTGTWASPSAAQALSAAAWMFPQSALCLALKA